MDKAARRRAILEAALAVFARDGFAGARLDEVARRAGVAKGTLYLYFTDKAALFRGLVEETVVPVLADADQVVALFPGTTRELLDLLIELLAARILDTPAQAVVRLMIAEGPRFPELAAFYHREVVSRGLALVRLIIQRGLDRGEISSDLAVRFPQLVISPAILAVVWNSMFGAIDPLDARSFLAAHRDLLLRGLGWRDS
ncbi:TetR/AcrR family transcriptional regulator [Xanthobacter dioxanivorans]|nr:TetR/AcrR family transcriptional regulator [Xanthobacter dioxanivorans]